MNIPMSEEANNDDLPVSKSQLKRESHALQKLGEALIALSSKKLQTIQLPDNLQSAIHDAQKIKSHSALKRQRQYIGKLMRNIDAEPIESALDKLLNRDAQSTARLHRIEKWRDRLLEEGDTALSELVGEYPACDRQQLRQWIRSAQREQKLNKPPASSRQLFRYLRELMESSSGEDRS